MLLNNILLVLLAKKSLQDKTKVEDISFIQDYIKGLEEDLKSGIRF